VSFWRRMKVTIIPASLCRLLRGPPISGRCETTNRKTLYDIIPVVLIAPPQQHLRCTQKLGENPPAMQGQTTMTMFPPKQPRAPRQTFSEPMASPPCGTLPASAVLPNDITTVSLPVAIRSVRSAVLAFQV
jgi:hypothetical protein